MELITNTACIIVQTFSDSQAFWHIETAFPQLLSQGSFVQSSTWCNPWLIIPYSPHPPTIDDGKLFSWASTSRFRCSHIRVYSVVLGYFVRITQSAKENRIIEKWKSEKEVLYRLWNPQFLFAAGKITNGSYFLRRVPCDWFPVQLRAAGLSMITERKLA